MEGHKEYLLLLLNHQSKVLLFLAHNGRHLFILWKTLSCLHFSKVRIKVLTVLHFLFKLFDSDDIALDLVLDDFDSCVSDLVLFGYQRVVTERRNSWN